MTWLKLSKKALYLMKSNDNCFIDKVDLAGTAHEGQMRLAIPLQWFSGRDIPSAMIIDTKAEEPLACQLRQAAGLTGKRILLDPAYGEAGNLGAMGISGACEAEETLKQAQIIKQLLEGKGATVDIVPNELNLAVAAVGSYGGDSDCFISLKLNALDFQTNRHTVYVDSDASDEDMNLANAIHEALNTEFSDQELPPDASAECITIGVKKQGFAVLRGVPLQTPAVVTESFFIDATSPEKLASYTQRSAIAIAHGIEKFLTIA